MPQLDKVTFLSQFFWSTFFFVGFYFLILKYALPQISRILKLRSKKINSSQEGAVSLVDENSKVRGSYDLLVANGLNTSRNVFQESNEQIENWLNNTYIQSKGHYQKADKSYLQSVGISLLSEKLPASFLSTTNKTEKLLLIALLQKFQGVSLKSQKTPSNIGSYNKPPHAEIPSVPNTNPPIKPFKQYSISGEGKTDNQSNAEKLGKESPKQLKNVAVEQPVKKEEKSSETTTNVSSKKKNKNKK